MSRKLPVIFAALALSGMSAMRVTSTGAQVAQAPLPPLLEAHQRQWYIANVHDIPAFAAVDKPQTRTLKFPTDASAGALSLVDAFWRETPVGDARGTVTVTIPKYQVLSLQVNGRYARHPELLLKLPEQGIERLQISMIDMEDDTGSVTDRILKYADHLKSMRLLLVRQSDIGAQGYANIEKLQSLQSIDNFGTSLSKKGMASILKLPNLVHLSMQEAQVNDDKLVGIEHLKSLKQLSLKHDAVTDATLKRVAALTDLRYLLLAGDKISDNGIRYLKELKALVTLDLSGTPVSDDTVEMVSRLPMMRDFNLCNTRITDKSVSSLLKMKNLRVTDLRQTKLSYDALMRLKPLHLDNLFVPATFTPEQMKSLQTLALRVTFGTEPKRYNDAELFSPRH